MRARNPKALRRLRAEVDSWAAETRLLIETCRVLIAHYGRRSELQRWDTAMKEPLRRVALVEKQFSSGARRDGVPSLRAVTPFRCAESTARVISPLVEIVGGPVATFVYTIRKIFPRAEQSRQIYPYGMFSVTFADAVTQPLWERYRHLAPAEWKRVFPARRAG